MWCACPGMAEHQFPQAEKQRWAAVMLQQPPLPAPRFAAALVDFALIFRGEGSIDAVLGYEMC